WNAIRACLPEVSRYARDQSRRVDRLRRPLCLLSGDGPDGAAGRLVQGTEDAVRTCRSISLTRERAPTTGYEALFDRAGGPMTPVGVTMSAADVAIAPAGGPMTEAD